MSDEITETAEAQAVETEQPQEGVEGAAQTEQPEVPAAQTIPKYRFDEVNTRMKQAEERAKQYEEALAQVQGKVAQQPLAGSDDLDDEQRYLRKAVDPLLRQHLQPLQQEMQTLLERQTVELEGKNQQLFHTQWMGKVENELLEEVESTYTGMKATSPDAQLSRQDVFDYVLGKRHRNKLDSTVANAQATQQAVQEGNKVATAEAGNTTTAPSDKRIEDMSADEILAKFGGTPFD